MRFGSDRFQREMTGCERSPASLGARARQQATGAGAEPSSGREARPDLYGDPAPSLTPSDDILEQRIAEELHYARRMLDSIGGTLVSDPVLVCRYPQCFQQFDILGQLLGHLASVISTTDRARAVERIGMEDLKDRLTRPTRSIY